jgi:hypothetical protein
MEDQGRVRMKDRANMGEKRSSQYWHVPLTLNTKTWFQRKKR